VARRQYLTQPFLVCADGRMSSEVRYRFLGGPSGNQAEGHGEPVTADGEWLSPIPERTEGYVAAAASCASMMAVFSQLERR